MNTLMDYLKDILKSVLIGLGIGSIITIVSGIIGLCANGGEVTKALRLSQQVIFIIGALVLIIVAALILKRDGCRILADNEGWRKQFKVVNFPVVILIVGVFILFVGGMLDYV